MKVILKVLAGLLTNPLMGQPQLDHKPMRVGEEVKIRYERSMKKREPWRGSDERIYIPQHPRGEGKKIAVVSTDTHESSGFPEVDAILNFLSGRIAGTYYGDTDGGSSGSPVLGYDDHCAVILHSGAFGCDSFGNTGTVINQIIEDLDGALPASAFCDGERIFADGFESGTTNAWQ